MRTDPIRDREAINTITEALMADETEQGKRRFLLWVSGIFMGRRVSDILQLKVKDVYQQKAIRIHEQKTGKVATIYTAPGELLYDAYQSRLQGRDLEDYVFASPRPDPKTGKPRPITRRTAYRDLQAIKTMAGLDGHIGTHSMRKTYGYWYYQTTHDVAGLMSMLNHSSERVTLLYIGIAEDEHREAYKKIWRMYKNAAN